VPGRQTPDPACIESPAPTQRVTFLPYNRIFLVLAGARAVDVKCLAEFTEFTTKMGGGADEVASSLHWIRHWLFQKGKYESSDTCLMQYRQVGIRVSMNL
jgi:hypothetical protein